MLLSIGKDKGLRWDHVYAEKEVEKNGIDNRIEAIDSGNLCPTRTIRITSIIVMVLLYWASVGLGIYFTPSVGILLAASTFVATVGVIGLEALIRKCVIAYKRSLLAALDKEIPAEAKEAIKATILDPTEVSKIVGLFAQPQRKALFNEMNLQQLLAIKEHRIECADLVKQLSEEGEAKG